MKIAMFCYGKFHYLLEVENMLKQKCLRYPRFGLFDRQYYPPIPANIKIFSHSISISTKPYALPSIKNAHGGR